MANRRQYHKQDNDKAARSFSRSIKRRISDCYIKELLSRRGFERHNIPQEIVDLQKIILILKREIKRRLDGQA